MIEDININQSETIMLSLNNSHLTRKPNIVPQTSTIASSIENSPISPSVVSKSA